MSSEKKTPKLYLNQWVGADKPKRDDFNSDNNSIDLAYGQLLQSIEEIDTLTKATNRQLSALDTTASGISALLGTHTGNSTAHCSQPEKDKWNAAPGLVLGNYVGNAAVTRQITMGFRPRFGVLFATDRAVVQSDWSNYQSDIHFAFFSNAGCSKFVAVTDTGITVSHHYSQPSNMCSLLYNELGVTYVYAVFQ